MNVNRTCRLGLAFGVAASLAAAEFLRAQLFGASAADPVVYLLMIALLIAIALLAGLLPAWRAARVQPLEALRQD